MLKCVSWSLLAVALALAGEPFVSVGVVQPFADDMRTAYRVLPGLDIGVAFPRTELLTLRTSLSGCYWRGVGAFSPLALWTAALRFGPEVTVARDLGLRVTPGVMLAHGAERMPEADTMGNISERWYSGTSLGFWFDTGIMLLRARNWVFALEAGLDLLAIPTDRLLDDYWVEYYAMRLSGFRVGLAARRSNRSAD